MGGLDIIVNNAWAAAVRQILILDITSEAFDSTMRNQYLRAFLDHPRSVAALAARVCNYRHNVRTGIVIHQPDLYDYAQTKAATMNYVKSLAKQFGPKGIRVNGVAPGPVWTALQISGGAQPEKQQMFGSWTMFGRPGHNLQSLHLYMCSWPQRMHSFCLRADGYGSSGGVGTTLIHNS